MRATPGSTDATNSGTGFQFLQGLQVIVAPNAFQSIRASRADALAFFTKVSRQMTVDAGGAGLPIVQIILIDQVA